MIAKLTLSSPLASPTMGAVQLRNRLPVQFRRCLPLYVAGLILVIFLFNVNLFRSSIQQTSIDNSRKPRVDFPHKIWQTWKVGPLYFEPRDLDVAKSWTGKNPTYRYEVLTDNNDIPYVEYHFGPEGFNRTDIVTFYKSVKDAIVKADLLRYLVMYAEGGLYADIDVEALKPLGKFVPERYNVRDIDMIIGVEIDEPDWKDHPILGPKSRSFCQWTFMCKPELPVMMRLIEHIMVWLNGVAAEQKVPLAKVELSFDQIISGTGPSAFTKAIIDDMNTHKDDINGKDIDWNTFHDMSESKIVSRVLVLTVEAFAAGQGHSNSGTHDARAALVRHHYHASNWPSRHPRYKHPAFGEVEACNWHDDCVNKWDKDVAAFEKMTKPDQEKIIAEKKKEREEKERQEKEEADRRKKEHEDAEKKRKQEEDAARKKKEDEKIANEKKLAQEKEAKEKKLAEEKALAKEKEEQLAREEKEKAKKKESWF
ncbi:nucleotide-diphospho-sugar transferase [Podospora appendiculata]|uniref:Nucleotide-diphospho-sugar transferase n=1 Tax=Podospora appendiculata TaxID=314037 RepID=A0AAE0X8D1_9PEZI|nr:nucleotide-diphospho-sugar transferase [Podospora appendiculata]